MNKPILWLIVGATVLLPSTVAAEAPRFLAGYELGGRLADIEDRIIKDSVIPVRFLESMKEAEIEVPPGFKRGLAHYTTCSQPSRIVRLRFKYQDKSKRFYDRLLERYKKQLGKPHEWRGDPFHIILAWKWRFKDKDGNDISLILQHNTRDLEEKIGNSVKMTMWNLVKEEDACFEQRQSESPKKKTAKAVDLDWDLLIPK